MWSVWIVEPAFVHDFELKTSPFFPKVKNNQRARLWPLLHIEYMSLLDWTGVGMCGRGHYPCEVLCTIIRVLHWTKHEIGGDVWNIYIEYVCVCICMYMCVCVHMHTYMYKAFFCRFPKWFTRHLTLLKTEGSSRKVQLPNYSGGEISSWVITVMKSNWNWI